MPGRWNPGCCICKAPKPTCEYRWVPGRGADEGGLLYWEIESGDWNGWTTTSSNASYLLKYKPPYEHAGHCFMDVYFQLGGYGQEVRIVFGGTTVSFKMAPYWNQYGQESIVCEVRAGGRMKKMETAGYISARFWSDGRSYFIKVNGQLCMWNVGGLDFPIRFQTGYNAGMISFAHPRFYRTSEECYDDTYGCSGNLGQPPESVTVGVNCFDDTGQCSAGNGSFTCTMPELGGDTCEYNYRGQIGPWHSDCCYDFYWDCNWQIHWDGGRWQSVSAALPRYHPFKGDRIGVKGAWVTQQCVMGCVAWVGPNSNPTCVVYDEINGTRIQNCTYWSGGSSYISIENRCCALSGEITVD